MANVQGGSLEGRLDLGAFRGQRGEGDHSTGSNPIAQECSQKKRERTLGLN
jgi:hypothetical protein